jgi:hypothetical protein
MPAAFFDNAPRFHGGLAADEFAAVLKRGERVLTEDVDRRAQRTMSGLSRKVTERPAPVVHFNITTKDADSFKRSQSQILVKTQSALARASRRDA